MTKNVHGGFALAFGVPLGAIGAALMKHGSFGLSPFYSVSLSLFEATGRFTMGTWNAVFQFALILLLIVILRKLKLRYPLSFAVAAVSSMILDAANAAFTHFPHTIPVRLVCYVIGFLVMTMGIALMAECKLPVAPMNLFVRELSEEWGRPFRNVKLVFDICCLAFSTAVSLGFAGYLSRGIGPGTVLSAFLTGPLTGLYISLLRKRFRFYSNLGKASFDCLGFLQQSTEQTLEAVRREDCLVIAQLLFNQAVDHAHAKHFHGSFIISQNSVSGGIPGE